MERLETSSKAQHQEMVDIMKRSNKTALMLYSQNSNYTFNQAYVCHEASEQYYNFTKKMKPYGLFLDNLDSEIDRYNKLIKVLQELPPRTSLNEALNDKESAELLKKEAQHHALMEKEMKKEQESHGLIGALLPGTGGKRATTKDSLQKDSTTPQTRMDSLREELKHHRRPAEEESNEPFVLDSKGQADRAECIKFATIILQQYILIRNKVKNDSKNYEKLKNHLENVHNDAQKRYKSIQQNIFVNGEQNYFHVLSRLPMYLHFAKREISDKYANKNYDFNHVRSEWRGPVIFGLIFAVIFYFLLAFGISNLIVRVLMKRVKKLRKNIDLRLKTNCMIVAASLLLFAVVSMIAKNSIGHNFFIMAFGLLINYSWLVAVVLISFLIRLTGRQIRSTLPLFMPIIILGFFIIVFRIIFIPNTLVNIAFPPLLVLFFCWQFFVTRHYGKDAKTNDRVYSWISLTLMGIATVMAWMGYVLMAVELFIWWLFQLTFLLTITCFYDILVNTEGKYMQKKLGLKKVVKQNYIKRDGKLIQHTWFFEFLAMAVIPVCLVWSIAWSVYLAAQVFDLTEMVMHVFMTPFVDVKGLCRLSVFMIVLVFSLYFVFNFVCYIVKSTYRYLRIKHLAAKNKGVAVATNQANFTLFYNITAIVVWGSYIILILVLFQVPKSGISIVTAGLATGVGFAMKDLLNNFFYGLSLMTGRLRVGDWIECDGVRGKVDSINYQSTQILTEDGSIISFLNSTLFSNNFRNLTKNHFYVMSKITIGVAYGSDINSVRKVLVDAITKMMHKNKSGRDVVNTNKGVNVLVANFGESSIDLLVVYWTLVEEKTVFDLQVKETIYNTLNEYKIEIPFPQRDLNLRNIPPQLASSEMENSNVPKQPLS